MRLAFLESGVSPDLGLRPGSYKPAEGRILSLVANAGGLASGKISIAAAAGDRLDTTKSRPALDDSVCRRDGLLLRLSLDDAGAVPSNDGCGSVDERFLRPGQSIILDPSLSPSIMFDPPARWLDVMFERQYIEAVAEQTGGQRSGVASRLLEACGHPIEDAAIRDLGRSLAALVSCNDQSIVVVRNQILLALASYILLSYANLAPIGRGGLAAWQVRKAQERMSANLSQPMDLDEVATTCGLSLSHFSRGFRRSVGLPPHAWRARQRIEHAMMLMRTSGKPLVEIALESGFADQSHFTRVFSKEVAVSPGAWRRNCEDAVPVAASSH